MSHARNAINYDYVNCSDLQAQQRHTSVVPPLGTFRSHFNEIQPHFNKMQLYVATKAHEHNCIIIHKYVTL